MKISAAGKTYEFDFAAISNRDVFILEDVLGMTIADWSASVTKRTPGARDMTVLVWLARRQAGEHDLAFDDVEFPIGSFGIEDDSPPEPGDADPTPGSSGTPDGPSSESGLPTDDSTT